MYELIPQHIDCPYCGEPIEILVDPSDAEQEYIEDCQVCCRPITIEVNIDHDGDPVISASHEDE